MLHPRLAGLCTGQGSGPPHCSVLHMGPVMAPAADMGSGCSEKADDHKIMVASRQGTSQGP